MTENDWLDSEEFERAVDRYRIAPLYDLPALNEAFEDLKDLIREKYGSAE